MKRARDTDENEKGAFNAKLQPRDQLIRAVFANDIEATRTLLAQGVPANTMVVYNFYDDDLMLFITKACPTKITLFDYALLRCSIQIVQLLARAGARSFCHSNMAPCPTRVGYDSSRMSRVDWCSNIMYVAWYHHPTVQAECAEVKKANSRSRSMDVVADIDHTVDRSIVPVNNDGGAVVLSDFVGGFFNSAPLVNYSTEASGRLGVAFNLCRCPRFSSRLGDSQLYRIVRVNDIHIAKMVLRRFVSPRGDCRILQFALQHQRHEMFVLLATAFREPFWVQKNDGTILRDALRQYQQYWTPGCHSLFPAELQATVRTCMTMMYCNTSNPWQNLPREIAYMIFRLLVEPPKITLRKKETAPHRLRAPMLLVDAPDWSEK